MNTPQYPSTKQHSKKYELEVYCLTFRFFKGHQRTLIMTGKAQHFPVIALPNKGVKKDAFVFALNKRFRKTCIIITARPFRPCYCLFNKTLNINNAL